MLNYTTFPLHSHCAIFRIGICDSRRRFRSTLRTRLSSEGRCPAAPCGQGSWLVVSINAEGWSVLMLTPCQYHRRQMHDSYRKLGPMPPIVHPLKMPPTEPAMNGQMAFTAALSLPAQSMFSFMLFLFISLVVGWVWRFALCNWLLGRTCGTRKTSRTFDFQKENAGELRAWQISWTFQGEFESTKYAICTLKAALIISRRIACRKALQANFKKPSSYASCASYTSYLKLARREALCHALLHCLAQSSLSKFQEDCQRKALRANFKKIAQRKVLRQISGNHRPTRLARPTRPTSSLQGAKHFAMSCSIAQRKAQKWFAPYGKRFLRARNTVLAYVRPRESEIRFRLAWSTDKKKSPRRNAEVLMKYFIQSEIDAKVSQINGVSLFYIKNIIQLLHYIIFY